MRKNIGRMTIIFLIIFTVFYVTVGFSSLSSNLILSDILSSFRIQKEIRITDFYVTSSSNNGSTTYYEYNYDRITTDIVLPNQNSTVTYILEVTNLGSFIAQIEDITGLPSNITYELNNYTLGDDICDNSNRCKNGVTKEISITFKYKNNGYNSSNPNGEYNITAIFNFSENYQVTYYANMFNTSISRTINGLTLTYEPYNNELTINGTTSAYSTLLMSIDNMTFVEGEEYFIGITRVSGTITHTGMYTLVTSINTANYGPLTQNNKADTFFDDYGGYYNTLIVNSYGASEGRTLNMNIWCEENNSVTFNNYKMKIYLIKQVSVTNEIDATYDIPSYIPRKNGFEFGGWYTLENGGSVVTSSTIMTTAADHTLYAHWTDNDVMTAPTISFESNYITSGLQVLYDGRNNTGNGNDSNSSIWKNIKDNTNGTLHNNTWGDGYLSFNGSNSYVTSSSSYHSSNITLEAVFSLNVTDVRQQIIGNPTPGGGGIQLFVYSNNFICASLYENGYWNSFCSNIYVSTNTIYRIALTFDGSDMKLYSNGVYDSELWVGGAMIAPNNNITMTLGCFPNIDGGSSSHFLNGKIYSARVYNRALNESEILNNYLVDSLYSEQYVNLTPRVTISGGTSTVGIFGHQYSMTSNIWNTYDSSNKPLVEGPTIFNARVINSNHTPGPAATETIYIDPDPPNATLNVNVVDSTLMVSVSAQDPLSGIKEYGYLLTSTNVCNSSLNGFAVSSSNTYNVNNYNTNMEYVCVKITDNANNTRFVSESIPNGLSVGDEIEIKGEKFYVVSTNENTTVLLAKYNLLVGITETYNKSTDNYTFVEYITSSTPGYGLQSSTARGYYDTGGNVITLVGEVPFSGTNYWDNSVCQYTNSNLSCTGSNGLLAAYSSGGAHYNSEPYPYVYRSNIGNTIAPTYYSAGYQHVQNNGYTVAYYVENYVNALKAKGAPSSITGRLLSEEEIITLGCSKSAGNCNNAPSWVYNTSYWLGSASTQTQVWAVMSNAEIYDVYSWHSTHEVGLRVAIEIPTSECHNIYDIEFASRQNQNSITPGDEIVIGSEHFYVVSSNQNETAMLAKYNLLVGDVFDYEENEWGEYFTYVKTLNGNDPGYGLQNSTAKGAVNVDPITHTARFIGTVGFASTSYWDSYDCGITNGVYGCTGTSGLLPEYSQDGASYNGNPYPYVYRSNIGNTIAESVNYNSGFGTGFGVLNNNGYTISYYVEQYISTLKSLGAPVTTTGRLLSAEEAASLGCDMTFDWGENFWCSSVDDENNPTTGTAPAWVYSTSYSLGSAAHYDGNWRIMSTGQTSYDLISLEGDSGVRPVIVIPTSVLN